MNSAILDQRLRNLDPHYNPEIINRKMREYIDELESIVIESEMRQVHWYGQPFAALLYLDERQKSLVEKLRESK